MEEVSTSAVRKCCMTSFSRYATRCYTLYGSCTLVCRTIIRRGVSLYDSLTERRVMVQRVPWAVRGSQYHLSKGARCDQRIFAYVFQQNGWGEPVRVGAWEGEVPPTHYNLLCHSLLGLFFPWEHHCGPSRRQWCLSFFFSSRRCPTNG